MPTFKCRLIRWIDWCHYYIIIIIILLVPLILTVDPESYSRIVRVSEKNITAYNNRNLTIVCYASLVNRTIRTNGRPVSFTTNARMALSFMTKPRGKKPLHQLQSFLHCLDPERTDCLSEFDFDISCLEDQMDENYIRPKTYTIEAACQVDDSDVCSVKWNAEFRNDCYDLANVMIISAPKLGEKCLLISENKTLECGYNQECNTNYGICLCKKNYIASNKQCKPLPQDDELLTLINQPNVTASTYENDLASFNPDEEEDDANNGGRLKLSKGTLRSMVIFLSIIAILLCIALGIVILWSRHYRRLLKDDDDNDDAAAVEKPDAK